MYQDYLLPASIDEALGYLQEHSGRARVIAGGTDLVIDTQEEKYNPNLLVDISKISSLKDIQLDSGMIRIGGGVTHNDAANSSLIREKAALLADACASVGSLQIRNIATLAGNVVNAQPAADAAVALVALDAVAEIASPQGVKEIPVEELYAGVGKSVVDSTREIVTAIKFPALEESQGSSFARLAQRRALALPMLNVAVTASFNGNKFQSSRIVMAPVGPGPVRAQGSEEMLQGAPVDEATMEKAGEKALESAHPRSSNLRGSAEYRKEVLKVLVKRALQQSAERAGIQ